MSFADSEYLLFLGALVVVFPFLARSARPLAMLTASAVFYSTQEPWHGVLLAAVTALSFALGLAVERARTGRARAAALVGALLTALGPLVVFKCLARSSSTDEAMIPLGLSFYSFQVLGYLLDVRRGRHRACRNPIDFALFVTFFPQLIAGPIERAGRLIPQLRHLQPVGLANLSMGLRLILWGLLKKTCLADRWRPVLFAHLEEPQGHDSVTLAVTALGLLVTLYLDFSAYTDIARGSARLFGVELAQNFRAPFLATSTADFARRWHMSLILWIEHYLYAPLMRGKIGHGKIWRANVVLVVLFCLWHGVYATYLAAGLGLGAVIAAEQSLGFIRRQRLQARGAEAFQPPMSRTKRRFGSLLGWLFTLALWSHFAVILFAAESATTAAYLRALWAMRWPTNEQWSWIGGAMGLMSIGLFGQASSRLVDLGTFWSRAHWTLKAAFWVALVWVIGARSVPHAEDFVYFHF